MAQPTLFKDADNYRLFENDGQRTSPKLSILRQALERGTRHSPCFSETPMIIGLFENDEQGYKEEVVDMKSGLAMQHRPFYFGEGKEG